MTALSSYLLILCLIVFLFSSLMVWNPGPIIRNYKTNDGLDKKIKLCLDSGVKSVVMESHHCISTFNNGYTIRFWCSNKFYAYAQSGEVTTNTGKVINWSCSMPSRCTVKRLYKMTEAKAFD